MSYDPTRTTALRARFVSQVNRRWRTVKTDLRKSIVDNDCFGIADRMVALAALPPEELAMFLDAAKVDRFMAWLREQEEAGILETVFMPSRLSSEPWSNLYIDSAYRQGIRRAYSELHKAGYATPIPIDMAFGQPVHAQRVALLYNRTWEDLKTVAQVVNARVRQKVTDALSSELARGIAEGKAPKVVAKELYAELGTIVDGIGLNRCRTIARTEIIRAHHHANILEYRQAAKDMEVEVLVEWSTAGDERVCEKCAGMAHHTYTLDQIESMLPAHPNCRCSAIPARRATMRRRAA